MADSAKPAQQGMRSGSPVGEERGRRNDGARHRDKAPRALHGGGWHASHKRPRISKASTPAPPIVK